MSRSSRIPVQQLVLLALCIALGLVCKRFVSPMTNLVTDFIRLPGGGAASAFSLMFLVFGASMTRWPFAATAAGFVQGCLALVLGMGGYQGALAPITYAVPGIVIDLVRRFYPARDGYFFLLATALANGVNALSSNLLVFHFSGRLLLLWVLVAVSFGVLAGGLAQLAVRRLDRWPEFRSMRVAVAGEARKGDSTKMKKMRWAVALSLLLTLTVFVACGNREATSESLVAESSVSEPEGAVLMTLMVGEEEFLLEEADLDRTEFSGTLVNGKGEESEHTYRGVLLKDLLEAEGVEVTEESSITITAADNYSAQYSGAEVLEEAQVYLAIEVDGENCENPADGVPGVEVVVFGDEDSKRCVRSAVKIEVQ